MAFEWTDIVKKDVSKGIDSYSARTNIQDGYAEDILNHDSDASGSLPKRKGYIGHRGWVPVRVKEVSHSGTDIIFTFDDSQSIDLGTVASSPIVVYGKLDSSVGGTGDFTSTNAVHYYSSFEVNNKDVLLSGSNTLPKTAAVHGLSTSFIFAALAESDSSSDNSHTELIPDQVSVNESSYQVDIDYTIPSDSSGFFYYKDKSVEAGTTYSKTVTVSTADASVAGDVTDNSGIQFNDTGHGFRTGDRVQLTTTGTLPTGLSTGTDYYINRVDDDNYRFATSESNADSATVISWTDDGSGVHTVWPYTLHIPSTLHGLSNFNIGVKCFDDNSGSGEKIEVVPNECLIDDNGEVKVDFNTAFPDNASGTAYIVLTACLVANIYAGSATSGTNTFTFSVSDQFNFYYIYYYDSGDSSWHSVIPSSVSYDASTGQTSVEYVLATATESVEVYWESASNISNSIKVTDTTGTSETYPATSQQQLTVWGLSHDDIYKSTAIKGGHVNHIDSYSSAGDTHLICGLGGNIFKSQSRAEAGATTYLIPTGEMRLRGRIDTASDTLYISPLFDESGSSMNRTRGLVTDASIENNRALVTAATYVSSGVVDYTLTFTSKTGNVSDGNEIDVDYDKLTVSSMANNVHNGTFIISSIQSDSSTETVIRCSNSSVVDATTDETAATGRAGVFTDKLTFVQSPRLAYGDVVNSSVLSSSKSVSNTNSTNVYLLDITSELGFPDGVVVYGSRTSSIVPIRISNANSVENFVKGDMLNVDTCDSQVRVKNIFTGSSKAVTITGDGTTATASSLSGDLNLSVGQKVFIYGTSNYYDGEQTVVSVPSSTSFTFASTSTASEGGVLEGPALELDTSITVEDAASPNNVTVDGRWIPVEAPTNFGDLTKETYTYHLDSNAFDNQSSIRSVMASDNMYFTNQDDEVYKYDGTNLYRASLPRWQPQLFVQFDTTTGSLEEGFSITSSAINATEKSISYTAPVFNVGDRIYDAGLGKTLTVVEVVENNAAGTITYKHRVAEDVTGISTGTVTLVKTYKYYARLNLIDANNNIIASAATGHNDMIVEQTAAGQFHLKLVGMPVFDNYDYDRIEVELYRTKANTEAPFYLVKRKTMSFDDNDAYVEFDDGTIDDLLINLDKAHSALKGTELGTAWNQPSRAKYITSISNRLALANIKGYPKLDCTIFPTSSSLTAANLDGFTMLFKKDNTDTSTTTDMTNRVQFEFTDSTTALASGPATDIDNASSADYFDVTIASHTFAAGDWIYLHHAATGSDNDLRFAGWWQIHSAPTANSIRIYSNTGTSAAGSSDVTNYVKATAEEDVPVYLGTDGNYNQKDGNTSGSVEYIAALRLSNAINCSMACVNASIETTFTPWMLCGGGNDFDLGQFVVDFPTILSTTPEVVLGTIGSSYDIFINNAKRSSSEEVGSATLVAPSRVLISYENFPEIFEGPEVGGESVVDVNTADGQAITGIIPFYGESSFGGANLNDVLVIFKEHSIYILDINTLEYQKVDSRGLGCTAPYSIAPTKSGIVFANESGIYRLDRNMGISYVGKMMQGKWQNSVNRTQLSEATATHFGVGRQYKLSIPVGSDTVNSEVYVYAHDREGVGQEYGAWTRYDNHPVKGWANQDNDSYFASTSGDVFKVRRDGTIYDYRDDASAISSEIKLRPEDFDLPNVRKNVRALASSVKYDSTSGINVLTAVNLSDTFNNAGSIVNSSSDDGESVRHSLSKRKCTYIQAKYTHSTIDEGYTLNSVVYTVGRMDIRGSRTAADRS